LRWLPNHAEIDDESCIEEIVYALKVAMELDEGTGEWVGLMGFSQGAKLVGSLLLEQQCAAEGVGLTEVYWKFGILLAGRAPLSNLNPAVLKSEALVPAGALSEGFQFQSEVEEEAKLRVPTLHVHGVKDAGLELHRKLFRNYCGEGSARLVEWEGEHRVPIKTKDVEAVVKGVWDLADRTGVKVERTM
jgi:hypothetical protein